MWLATPDELTDSVVLIGPNGETTVTDEELAVLHSHTFEGDAEFINAFVFDRSQATFVPKRWPLKEGAVIVHFVKTSESPRLRVIGVDSNGIKTVADLPLPTKLVGIPHMCIHNPTYPS